ncbi:head maturation protease, ClpP-related [Dactylosporangium sp. NPDC000244]|uniref:head maturation protease, ClpP-related n=1 Tax=Dactylosporangium sp. NPDC000244 TaxID=3154365 RepID=UPI0033333DEC
MNTDQWLNRLPNPLASAKAGEPRQWFRIRAAAAGTDAGGEIVADEVTVFIYGVIGGWWSGVDAKSFVAAINAIKTKQLNVHINSYGGSAYDGLTIFQALRNHSARIVTYVDGIAASAASVIAMAGDHRIVAPYASIMVHRAWTLAIGHDLELHKEADEIGRLSKNYARLYANRGTTSASADDWLAVMTDETWYYGEEAVEAGLMHEVQEDAEKTGDDSADDPAVVVGTEGDDEDEDDDVLAMNAFAQQFFGFQARDRSTPPRMPAAHADVPRNADPAVSETATETPTAEQAKPEMSGAEPEPTTEPEEDPVSDLSEISSRLGLTDDADETAVLAALDELKAKADNPPPPQPDPAAEAAVKAQADENAELRKTVDVLSNKVEAMSTELAATKAEKAANTKKSILDDAQAKGKFTPAERAQWEADYDEAPAAVARMLDRIAAGTAVPVTAAGETGAAEPTDTTDWAAWDAELARLDGPVSTKGKN